MGLSKSTIGLLHECAKIENLDLIKESTVKRHTLKEFYNELAELDELDDNALPYNEEKVDVHQYTNGRLLVEFEDLSKYMTTNNLGAKESLGKVCEYYNINEADVYVVIESVNDIMNELTSITVCSESTDPIVKKYAKEQLESVLDIYSKLRQDGIKLVVKPSNGTAIY